MIPARALTNTQFIARKKLMNGKEAILWRYADYQYEVELFGNELVDGVIRQVLLETKQVQREYYDVLSFLSEYQ